MRAKRLAFLFLLTFCLFSVESFAQSFALKAGLERVRVTHDNNDTLLEANGLLVEFSLEKNVLAMINAERARQGLCDLKWSDEAAKVARVHSENMAHYKFFSHQGLDGLMVNDRADSLNVDWQAIGENIAYNRGYDDPVGFTIKRWMESPSHHENIMDKRWKETGVGVIMTQDGTYYLTQVFIKH